MRFSQVLAEYGVPHYCKIDIEGHDRLCLADIDPADKPQSTSSKCPRRTAVLT